jgi:proline racemase
VIFKVVDAHTSGAPARTVIGGLDELGIRGETMRAKKEYIQHNLDWLRTALLDEPRGNPALCADLLLPPCDPEADVGLVILNQRPVGPLMSGGNILAFVTAILESGAVPAGTRSGVTTLRVDTPGGLVTARATCKDGKVEHVSVQNVPSYATHLDAELHVPGLGRLTVDVAFGGMLYLLVSAAQLGLDIVPERAADIAAVAERVRAAAADSLTVRNPVGGSAADTVDQVLVYGGPHSPSNSSRSAVAMPMLPGSPAGVSGVSALIDRCPCGTGTCAQVAALVAKGELAIGDVFRQESITGGVYAVRPLCHADVHGTPGIIPELTGSAHVYARSDIVISDDDPLRHGFRVGDLWASPAAAPAGD